VSEQTCPCPDCGKPRLGSAQPESPKEAESFCWRGEGGMSDLVARPRCNYDTIARLRAKVETLESALAVADRLREALNRRASYPSRVVADAVDAYDRARGAVYYAARERTRT